MEYTCTNQEENIKITDEDFLRKMRESKFGIVLPGRGSWATETKNRREIDYMMMKKPLLMTYSPTYYNPLVEGTHYIRWDKEESIEKIQDKYDIKAIAENGHKWYLDNASPLGVAKTFIQIAKEKFGDEILQGKS